MKVDLYLGEVSQVISSISLLFYLTIFHFANQFTHPLPFPFVNDLSLVITYGLITIPMYEIMNASNKAKKVLYSPKKNFVDKLNANANGSYGRYPFAKKPGSLAQVIKVKFKAKGTKPIKG